MRIVKRYSESAIRDIVDRVLNEALNESGGYEAPMSLDELSDFLVGKDLSLRITYLDGSGEDRDQFEGEIWKIEDLTEQVDKEYFPNTDKYYGVYFYGGVWGFYAQELTTLATRGRLYKDATDLSCYGERHNPNERWLFEIH